MKIVITSHPFFQIALVRSCINIENDRRETDCDGKKESLKAQGR